VNPATAFIEKSQKHNLPRNWKWMKIKDIGPVVDGDWILNVDYSEKGVRLLQVGDIGVRRFVGKSERFISESRAEELGCTFLKPNDILISRMPDPIGRACLLPNLGYPCITAVDVSIWRPDPQVADRKYLVYYLNSPSWFKIVTSLASGATRQRISRINLENILLPLAPLTEQKKIATILDEKFLQLEKAQAAVEAQLEAAKALPTAYLREVFEGLMQDKQASKQASG